MQHIKRINKIFNKYSIACMSAMHIALMLAAGGEISQNCLLFLSNVNIVFLYMCKKSNKNMQSAEVVIVYCLTYFYYQWVLYAVHILWLKVNFMFCEKPVFHRKLGKCSLKSNSWTYNFMSWHNLESSQTWDFCMDFVNHRGMVFYRFSSCLLYRNCKRLCEFE